MDLRLGERQHHSQVQRQSRECHGCGELPAGLRRDRHKSDQLDGAGRHRVRLAGNLYAANREGANGNNVIKIAPNGVRSVYASGLSKPIGLAIDASGNLYAVNESGSTIAKITTGGTVSTFATGLSGPYGLAADASGNIYAGNRGDSTITRYSPGGSLITPSPYVNTNLSDPRGMDFSANGDLYVANSGNHTIARIDSSGNSTTYLTLAGTGPNDVAFDMVGNLYVANNGNRTIHKYGPDGVFQFSWGLGGPRPQFLAFVPEPSTWIMGIVATALMAIVMRRSIAASHGSVGGKLRGS